MQVSDIINLFLGDISVTSKLKLVKLRIVFKGVFTTQSNLFTDVCFQPLTFFSKSSTLDNCLNSEYTCEFSMMQSFRKRTDFIDLMLIARNSLNSLHFCKNYWPGNQWKVTHFWLWMLPINLVQCLISDIFVSISCIRSLYFSLKFAACYLAIPLKCLRVFLEKFLALFGALHRCILNPVRHVWCSLFAKIVNGI